ncbi:MAG TPA: alpha/beta hydrolase-fold protein [Ktedonobacterales bacterium]|nr:alpha/beta hydrolase-fold protein [Ktedonobacterales bacterium]
MLLERAEREGTPLIDGETVTFVWRGTHAPRLIGDFNSWGRGNEKSTELVQIAPEVWIQRVTLPSDAYIEYTYIDGDRHPRDVWNPRLVDNGLGKWNQFFRMPDSVPTPLTHVKRGTPRGRLTRHSVEGGELIAGGKREVALYQPPTSDPAPLLVVFDGQDYRRRARLTAIVDNLFAQGRIGPLALALVAHGGQARIAEYRCNDNTIAFLLRHVLPLAREKLHLVDIERFPGAYGVLGASMGGLMALYAGLRVPEVFGHVLSQSGAFGNPHVADFAGALFETLGQEDVKPLSIWMDVGQLEWLVTVNRQMGALLQAKGYTVTYREYSGEHNYTSWRDDVWRGLEAQFGSANASA